MEGPTFITCRLINTNDEEEDDWKRVAIFWTRVKCKEKFCTMVINGSDLINFVAQEVIDKL